MSAPQPHATILSSVEGDPVRRRDPYTVQIGERTIRMFHGNTVLIGTEGDEDGPTSVSVALLLPACQCGCNMTGRGIEYVPSPDDARNLAAQLIEAADAVEAHAKASADALIDRVRNGSADR